MSPGPIELDLHDESATSRLGEDIAAIAKPGDLLFLEGALGAGKTVLARAVIRSMADDRELEVPSPSFTLVQPYEGRHPVLHVDLYRFASADEVDELGIGEAIASHVVLVEWPGHAGGRLGQPSLVISLSGSDTSRRAVISGRPDALNRLARSLAARAFIEASGWMGARRRHLTGDASTRSYETIHMEDRPVRILMNSPRQPDGPPIRDGQPYSRIAHLAESVVPFVAIDRLLVSRGFAAPEIEAADLEAGFLLIEHLGGEGVLDAAGLPVRDRYVAAAELLAEMHDQSWPASVEAAPGKVHAIPAYDHAALAIETELLIDWYLPHARGRPADEAERTDFVEAWRTMFGILDTAERSLILRDYHSPNLIWRETRSGRERIGLIDFQDALLGPSAYDVASLAQDARVTIPAEMEVGIVDAYRSARARTGPFDDEGFERAYAITAAQRATKILGIFVRLKERDGKPDYVRHLPRLAGYLRRSLAHPALAPVAECYVRLGIPMEDRV